MHSITSIYACLAFSIAALGSSFYDNPEQDVFPPTGPEAEADLRKRWDPEVFLPIIKTHFLIDAHSQMPPNDC